MKIHTKKTREEIVASLQSLREEYAIAFDAWLEDQRDARKTATRKFTERPEE